MDKVFLLLFFFYSSGIVAQCNKAYIPITKSIIYFNNEQPDEDISYIYVLDTSLLVIDTIEANDVSWGSFSGVIYQDKVSKAYLLSNYNTVVGGAEVVVIDSNVDTILSKIPIPNWAHQILCSRNGEYIAITHSGNKTPFCTTIIDTYGDSVLFTLPETGRAVFSANSEYIYVGEKIFRLSDGSFINSISRNISIIDRKGDYGFGIGNEFLGSGNGFIGKIWRVNLNTNSLFEVEFPEYSFKDMTISSDDSLLYAIERGGELLTFNANTFELIGTAEVFKRPEAISLDQGDKNIYVISMDNTVERIERNDFANRDTFDTSIWTDFTSTPAILHSLSITYGSIVCQRSFDCPQTANSINLTSCQPIVVNGTTYSSSGSFEQTLINSEGCDSILTINVTINEPTFETIDLQSCTSVTVNNVSYTFTDTYIQTLTNTMGCDSTLTINVTINNSSSASINVKDCDSVTVNNVTYDNSGSYIQNLTNDLGCDSTLTIKAIVIPDSIRANISVLDSLSLTAHGFIGLLPNFEVKETATLKAIIETCND